MRTTLIDLRLRPPLLEAARSAAVQEGVTINQLISRAIEEKLEHLRKAKWFAECALRGRSENGRRLLLDATWGGHEPPRPGDEIPPEVSDAQRAPRPRRSARRPRTSPGK